MPLVAEAGILRSSPQDDYRLIRKIGGGTYGDVYEAVRNADQQPSAVKIIKFESNVNEIESTLAEIRVMRELHQENIVEFYVAYLRRDRLWICMEFCSGGSIQDIYTQLGPMKEDEIAYVCRETIQGLTYLHQRGKMHRDIKGANILLTANGGVKLADFGISAEITSTLSKRKSFIGSPYW